MRSTMVITNISGFNILCDPRDPARRPSEVKISIMKPEELAPIAKKAERKIELEKAERKSNTNHYFEYIKNPGKRKKN